MSVENSDTADLHHMHSGCPLRLGQPCHEHAAVVSLTRSKSDIGVSFKRTKPAQHHNLDPLPPPPFGVGGYSAHMDQSAHQSVWLSSCGICLPPPPPAPLGLSRGGRSPGGGRGTTPPRQKGCWGGGGGGVEGLVAAAGVAAPPWGRGGTTTAYRYTARTGRGAARARRTCD